jgi:oxaloacetate decarboxylase alpha subunit
MRQDKVKLGWVLRDSMQSTGIWTFEANAIALLVEQAVNVGFSSLEIGGGQSYQIAMQQGYNPYKIIRTARTVIDKTGKTLPLQILLRGANQLGFKHYPSSLQQKNIDLLVDAGSTFDKADALIIRNFDALNDYENLRASIDYMVRKDLAAAQVNEALIAKGQPPTAKRLHVQAALSYVRPKSDDALACYGTNYYVAYAKKLMAIAQAAGGQLDSIAIKDMSGQLAPDIAKHLIPALKKLGLPVFLHCHSTDEAKSTATQMLAMEAGIDGIEVAIAPLAGGTSHNDINYLIHGGTIQDIDTQALETLHTTMNEIFGSRVSERQDLKISLEALKRMVRIGIPGGAIPFILEDMSTQVCRMLNVSMETALDMFEQEIISIQEQLGHVPLVTPTADIVAKQAINNLGNSSRKAAYKVIEPRFCSLVLGLYGNVNNYAKDHAKDRAKDNAKDKSKDDRIVPSDILITEINEYCGNIEPDIDGKRRKTGMIYPNPGRIAQDKHPTESVIEEDYDLYEDYINELHRLYPHSSNNYGSHDECFVLHVMRPAGKTDRLLTTNILGPTEDRLRFILKATLSLLPGNDIPESRDAKADEQTDSKLLNALGDYDGIVSTIQDLVLSGTKDTIRSRLYDKMEKIVDPICEESEEAQKNRYFVERRFLSLFASAVFWDLQRVCRRTGRSSRDEIEERTAFKLERIIAFTLRKRAVEGRGKAESFLS